MSMLAEPKNKSKYSLNPRGLDWVNDESKFGQKLMEKMGWSKGQGLGANKNGNIDHIHVSVKNDKTGVGCSRKAAEEWLDHQDSFSNILEELNAEHVDSNAKLDLVDGQLWKIGHKLLSLEHKSKNSNCRIHYQKFTKSKDLSVKNTNDLDCIFGTKVRRNKNSIQNHEDFNSIEKKDSDFGVKTSTSTLSSHQYFASKLNQLKQKSNKSEYNNSTDINSLDVNTNAGNKNERKGRKLKLIKLKKQMDVENSKNINTLEFNDFKDVNDVTRVKPNRKTLKDKKSKKCEDIIESKPCNISQYFQTKENNISIKDDTTLYKNLLEVNNLNLYNNTVNQLKTNESEVNKLQENMVIRKNKHKSKEGNVKLLKRNDDLVNESEVLGSVKKRRKLQKEKEIGLSKENSFKDNNKLQKNTKKKVKYS